MPQIPATPRIVRPALLSLLLAGVTATAAPPATTRPAGKAPPKPVKDEFTAAMDYGPFLRTSVLRPGGKPYKPVDADSPAARVTGTARLAGSPKYPVDPITDPVALNGIVIPLGGDKGGAPKLTACFDADALRWSGVWSGGWLDLSGTMLTNHKGVSQVTTAGTELFRAEGLGWGAGPAGDDFADPRPGKVGPLSVDRGRFAGLHVHGPHVVLAGRVNGVDVLESPGIETGEGGATAFTRTVRVAATDRPLALSLFDVAGAASPRPGVLEQGGVATAAGLAGTPPDGARVATLDGAVRLSLPASAAPRVVKVLIWSGPATELPQFDALVKASAPPTDPTPLTAGGPSRWRSLPVAAPPRAAPAAKKPTAADQAYAVDTIPLPDDNPWHSWMRLTGLDFFPDGRAAVCTLNGDVWVVAGIDDALSNLTWTRFATGLYHPMGLRVVDGKVHVRERGQLTRLHDLNADGEADFHENLSAEGVTHPSYHGFVFDLQTDPAGNFYYARGGIGMADDLAGHGQMTKLSKDGKTATVVATGLRAPNGLGAGHPAGWVTVGDNQGNWVPSSKIHMLDPSAPADFLGFLPHHRQPKVPADYAKPLLWLPHKLDNSSGGQAYVDSDKWGPYRGQWVHTSFGAAAMMLLLPDEGDAPPPGERPKLPRQAATVRLPLDFATGVMRPRFNPRDGQLHAVGVGGGWQTRGTRDGAFYRVRFTGKSPLAPARFRVVPGGVQLTFPEPLDRATATDVQNWGGEQWNYQWTEKYGSPDLSAKTPGKAGRDEVDIESVALAEDGKTVTLKVAGFRPVMQMVIQYNLKSAAGTEFEQELYATINHVPAGK